MRIAEYLETDRAPSLIRWQSGELSYITNGIEQNQKDNQKIHHAKTCQINGKLSISTKVPWKKLGKLANPFRKYTIDLVFFLNNTVSFWRN